MMIPQLYRSVGGKPRIVVYTTNVNFELIVIYNHNTYNKNTTQKLIVLVKYYL